MATHAKLTAEDVARLMGDRSICSEKEVAGRLSIHYSANGIDAMSPTQNEMAEDIFRVLLSRAEVEVRAMLALNLKQSDKLPVEIVKKMASDVQDVAAPVIEFSQVLSDDDLLNIISSAGGQHGKLVAIAKRNTVSETVSDALVETQVEQVAVTLVRNEGANISEKAFNKIVDQHSESAEVVGSMLERCVIPISVIEKVVDRVSATLRESLEKKYGNLSELKEVRQTLDRSIELTRLKLIGLKTSDSQLTRLICELDENNRLPPFSALSMANLQLFEVSLARILRISLVNVHRLLRDPNGIKALYQKAALPDNMYEPVALCVEAIMALEEEAKSIKPTPVQVMKRMRQMAGTKKIEKLDYLLAMISKDWAKVW